MKKILLVLAFLFGIAGVAKADFLYGGNIRDKNISLHYSTACTNIQVSTQVILIDLSSTTVWPHTETGFVNINEISVQFDKAAASTCTVKIGVVTGINDSTGTVKWFFTANNGVNVSNTNNRVLDNPYEAMYRLKVDGADINTAGTTPYLFSNDVTANSTTYQTDVAIPTSSGLSNSFSFPAAGDIVMDIGKTSAVVVRVTVDLQYTTDRR